MVYLLQFLLPKYTSLFQKQKKPKKTKLQGMSKKGIAKHARKIHNMKRQSIKVRLRYDTDVGIIRQGT